MSVDAGEPTSTSIVEALSEALKSVPTKPLDAAAIQLATQYAALIDAAAPHARYRKHLHGLHTALTDADELAHEHLMKIEEALSAHSVASDLGPKLLAVLIELGMTPRTRAAVAKGGVPPRDGDRPQKKALDELRARREKRRGPGTH